MERKLGIRLKQERERLGLTQEDVAKRVGITAAALSNYERGIRDPDTELLAKLANVYGVSTDYLLGLVDDPNPVQLAANTNEQTKDRLPDWVKSLPPDMQQFVEEESKHGWPYLRLAKGLKMKDLSPSELEAIVETWMDAKKRYEKESGK